MSEKSGTNGNFSYFTYFYLLIKVGDFALWVFLKAQLYAVEIRDLRQLRQKITDCCAIVNPNMLSRILTNMVKRLRKCVECRGEYIEHRM
jgi:hypothetical protein